MLWSFRAILILICLISGRKLILFNVRDVTDQKKAEEALRASEEKYRLLFENSVEGIFQTTPDGRFLSVNSSFLRIFGFDSQEELFRISIHDHLTGICNRRYIFERLDAMVNEYQRETRHFSLSIIDLDHFKKINGTHMHIAFSAGVANTGEPGLDMTVENLIRKADEHLYLAKGQGRDRIITESSFPCKSYGFNTLF